ncbi:MAG: anion permease [Candidatus Thermoplasmatota archaeon]|jgi:PiT family inorganic phosphate transporter|nr:anion permease [Candidatus Thermoplasmatota archaeon]
MTELGILILAVTFLLTALVSGNNLSAAVGTLVGSRTVSRLTGEIIGVLGFISGLILQGGLMTKAADSLMPRTPDLIIYVMGVSLIIFAIATFMRSPLSLSMAIVGAAIGVSVRVGFSIDNSYILFLVLVWLISPVFLMVLSGVILRVMHAVDFKNPWRITALSRVLLLITSFITAFALGANTLGLVGAVSGYGTYTIPVMVVAIAGGGLLLANGTIKRVGEEMFSMRYSNALVSQVLSALAVEFGTLFGIPLSSTQTLTSSVLGSGLSYRYKALYLRPFLVVAATWVISPLLGFTLGLAY